MALIRCAVSCAHRNREKIAKLKNQKIAKKFRKSQGNILNVKKKKHRYNGYYTKSNDFRKDYLVKPESIGSKVNFSLIFLIKLILFTSCLVQQFGDQGRNGRIEIIIYFLYY